MNSNEQYSHHMSTREFADGALASRHSDHDDVGEAMGGLIDDEQVTGLHRPARVPNGPADPVGEAMMGISEANDF